MKTYKKIILGILLVLAAFSILSSLAVYTGGYMMAILVLACVNIWFNWQYASGKWPEMSFFKAWGISMALAAVGFYITAACFAGIYQHPIWEMLAEMWARTPALFIKPVIITPISLLIWRWLFKEPRAARLAIASVDSHH